MPLTRCSSPACRLHLLTVCNPHRRTLLRYNRRCCHSLGHILRAHLPAVFLCAVLQDPQTGLDGFLESAQQACIHIGSDVCRSVAVTNLCDRCISERHDPHGAAYMLYGDFRHHMACLRLRVGRRTHNRPAQGIGRKNAETPTPWCVRRWSSILPCALGRPKNWWCLQGLSPCTRSL